LAASHGTDFIWDLAPEVGLEPTTIRLTAEGLTAEYVSFQWSIEEQRGHFGVLSARNWTRFWTRFFKQPGSRYLIVEEPKRGIRTRRTDKEVALAQVTANLAP
jgi:hypothetical protein